MATTHLLYPNTNLVCLYMSYLDIGPLRYQIWRSVDSDKEQASRHGETINQFSGTHPDVLTVIGQRRFSSLNSLPENATDIKSLHMSHLVNPSAPISRPVCTSFTFLRFNAYSTTSSFSSTCGRHRQSMVKTAVRTGEPTANTHQHGARAVHEKTPTVRLSIDRINSSQKQFFLQNNTQIDR